MPTGYPTIPRRGLKRCSYSVWPVGLSVPVVPVMLSWWCVVLHSVAQCRYIVFLGLVFRHT